MSEREAPERAAAEELSVRLQKRFGPEFTLDAQFTVPAGVTVLFGASGAGKTTVLECTSGLLRPDAGHIAIGSRTLFDSKRDVNVPVAKRGIGYVFQEPALFPHLSIEDNVHYGLMHLNAAARRERTEAILGSFRVDALRLRKPAEISGGERQRAALARALVTEPCALLLDEPLAALDAPTKAHIMDDLRAWNRTRGIPMLYVTHTREEVFALAERVVVLEQGKVVAEGTPQEVLHAPKHEAVAQLAGFENIFDATIVVLHEREGTMTCRIGSTSAQVEVPLGRVGTGARVRIGIRAGDILLAVGPPQGLSARNVLAGTITRLEQRDVTVIATVDCGLAIQAHLTPGARDALGLAVGRPVWLVIKTYSCHLLQ